MLCISGTKLRASAIAPRKRVNWMVRFALRFISALRSRSHQGSITREREQRKAE